MQPNVNNSADIWGFVKHPPMQVDHPTGFAKVTQFTHIAPVTQFTHSSYYKLSLLGMHLYQLRCNLHRLNIYNCYIHLEILQSLL